MEENNYTAIEGGSLEIGKVPFDVFIFHEKGEQTPFCRAEEEIHFNQRETLIVKRPKVVIKTADYPSYLEYIFKRIEKTVISQYIEPAAKAELFFNLGKELMINIQKDPLNRDTVARFGRYIKSYIDLMMHSKEAGSRLLELSSESDYKISHSFNTCTFCLLIGQKMFGNNRIKLWELGMGGMLMDIGMTKIDSNILNKKGKLTENEFATVKKHTVISQKIIQRHSLTKPIHTMGYYHHERFDGSGYPMGLKGEEIPLSARIGAVADVYDAITSNRVYKNQEDNISALMEMYHDKSKFDPVVLKVLTEIVLKREKIIQAFLEKVAAI